MPRGFPLQPQAVDLPIWTELLTDVEKTWLHASPVYWGLGVPPGDGSAVLLIPGFLSSDDEMSELYTWLRRIGYRSSYSGIGYNGDCPNLLMVTLHHTLGHLFHETGTSVHVVAYSYGGLMAHVLASQSPDRIRSVITLGSPIRGIAAHPSLLFAAETMRIAIQRYHGPAVRSGCLTGACSCEFMECLRGDFPSSVRQTAIYSKYDGVVDWRFCRTGDPAIDHEVRSTHSGLKFHPYVYSAIARSLAPTP
jgi:pimeloyl-ACP methyl ester carboxylesterase